MLLIKDEYVVHKKQCWQGSSSVTKTHRPWQPHTFSKQGEINKPSSRPPASLLTPLTSSPPATGVTGRSGNSCQHLAWGCSIALGRADACSAGRGFNFFFKKSYELLLILTNATSFPSKFKFIASTVPLPVSGDDLSALLLKITSLKCNSSTFYYFRILQENWKTLLCLPQFKCQHNFQTKEVHLELLDEKKFKNLRSVLLQIVC